MNDEIAMMTSLSGGANLPVEVEQDRISLHKEEKAK